MLLPQSKFTRCLAVFLPVCFVWAFVACVIICSEDVGHADEAQIVGFVEVNASDESDCCPMSDLPASLLPERPSFKAQISGDYQALTAPSIQSLPAIAFLYTRSTIGPSLHGPPLERLSVLRI